MEPTYQFARILFFTGIFLLFSIPLVLTILKKAKQHKVINKEVSEKYDQSFNNKTDCCNKSKTGIVTIII